MDPLSITAGLVGLLDTVSKLSGAVSRLKQDYRLADADLDAARTHALLLREEIRGLESRESSNSPPSSNRMTAENRYNPDRATETWNQAMDQSSFARAMTTARDLLSDIEASFPLSSEPHTWRRKLRWAMRDKQALARLNQQLQSTESTLHGVVAMEQLRVSRLIYRILLQQQSIIDKIENGQILDKFSENMAAIQQPSPQPTPAFIHAQFSEFRPTMEPPTRTLAVKPKLLPRIARFDRWGFSAHLAALPKLEGTSYQAVVHVSLLGRMYSIQLRVFFPGFSFGPMLHVCNTVPTDSIMAVACRAGDFDSVRRLLATGAANGSDMIISGRPMLDYAIESGSARLVRLLLDHGAQLDMPYGEHNMTALQSSFLRGRFDIARILLNLGADIEHVDSDGYSVLSYLWVVVAQPEMSVDFMGLCLASGFSGVNSCDSRGWTPFHRAAAIGTSEDIEAFLRLGASLDSRAAWYGWTALFFAASHDNIETFLTIVHHSGAGVYESLDGDGWSLLHCCIYFRAPRVMRLVLENGVDVNQKAHPAPLPEDPKLSYKEPTASDIAFYIGPNRCRMFMDALADTGRDADLEGCCDIFSDDVNSKAARGDKPPQDGEGASTPGLVYGAEDADDGWALLHWASYNGSPKVKSLLLLKGEDVEHVEAIKLEDSPTVIPTIWSLAVEKNNKFVEASRGCVRG